MKLQNINKDLLLKPLQLVSGIVERRHTLPILSNVYLRFESKHLEVIATDLEIQISTTIALEEDYPSGALTIPARKSIDILRALPEKNKVTLDIEESKAIVKSGKSKFNLQTLPSTDFPLITPKQEAKVEKITIKQPELKNMLLKVQFAMAQQDIRYYLNGLLMVVDKNTLTLVATDGHRLAHISTSVKNNASKKEIILPRKTVLELSKLLGETSGDVNMSVTDTQITINFGNVTLVSKLVDGKFPDFNRVIPKELNNKLSLDREYLQAALQRAAILSNEKFRGVRWVLTKNQLKIICTNSEQEEAVEELEVVYEGDPLDIGFNVNYLLDCLSNVSSKEINCALGDSNSSMLISLQEEETFKYVVMPMRI